MAKQLLTSIFFVAMTVTMTYAQQVSGNIESWNKVTESGEVVPQLDIYIRGPIDGKIGWSAWSLTSKGWSEAYAGLTFAPAKWIEVSGSIGLETDENPLRVGWGVWVGKGRWSLLSLHEEGGSGYWYRYLGTFQATKTVAVGVSSVLFVGTGPYIEKKLGKVALWGTYAPVTHCGVIGIKFNF